jgi:hypothetical protein
MIGPKAAQWHDHGDEQRQQRQHPRPEGGYDKRGGRRRH